MHIDPAVIELVKQLFDIAKSPLSTAVAGKGIQLVEKDGTAGDWPLVLLAREITP